MSIDLHAAAAALGTVAEARHRATALRTYAGAGDTLIAWGLAWLAGNLASQFAPPAARIVWPIAIVAASLWSMLRPRPARRADPRIILTVATAVGCLLLTLAILQPGARGANATTSLLVAASYIVLGIWVGARFAWLGLLLAAAVLIGWFVVPTWLFLCLALGGGGTLLVGGWWLRRA